MNGSIPASIASEMMANSSSIVSGGFKENTSRHNEGSSTARLPHELRKGRGLFNHYCDGFEIKCH